MAIEIASGFQYSGNNPNFARDLFETIEEMKNFPESSLPSIFPAWNKEDNNLYVYNVTNDEDPTTGRWRIFSPGNGASVDLSEYMKTVDIESTFVKQVAGKTLTDINLSTGMRDRYEEAYTEKHNHVHPEILDALSDVDGVLKYNGQDIVSAQALTTEQTQALTNATDHIANLANPHSTKISNLADVSVTSPTNGQVITWSEEQQKYILGNAGVEVSANQTWVVNGADTGIKLQDSSGMLRLEPTGVLKYFRDLIGATLKIENDTLNAIGIDGLKTPIAQLNLIQGLDKNIMEYIASLKGAMKFQGILADDDALTATLTADPAPASGDTYIVRISGQNDDRTTTYVFNGNKNTYESMGETNIQLRDFTVNPIDLTAEVTGILPKENIEGYHKHDHLDVLDKLTDAGGELLYDGKSLKGEQGEAGQNATANYNELIRKPSINGITLVSDRTFKDYGAYTEMLSKEDFESENKKGNVKQADIADDVTAFINQDVRNQPYMYYGTNMTNEIGKHILPINANDNSYIQQRIFENVVKGDTLSFDSLVDINNKAIIQVYTEIPGQENVEEVIKEYNESTQQSFICSPSIMFTETACALTGNKIIKPTYNEADGVYEYDLSAYTSITAATEVI